MAVSLPFMYSYGLYSYGLYSYGLGWVLALSMAGLGAAIHFVAVFGNIRQLHIGYNCE